MKHKFWFGKLIFGAVAIAALGGLVMGLWNWILPSLFSNVHPIDYWRALGLLVLCRLLFGGFHGGGWQRHHHMQRWHQMTDEEKQKFRAGLTGVRAWHHDWHEKHDARHEHHGHGHREHEHRSSWLKRPKAPHVSAEDAATPDDKRSD